MNNNKLEKYKIKYDLTQNDFDEMVKLYVTDEMSLREVAANMTKKLNPSTIKRILNTFCEVRTKSQAGSLSIAKGKYEYVSQAEVIFSTYLKSKKIDFIGQYRINGNPHPYDFYIPTLNLIVELDGTYWHCLRSHSKRKGSEAIHAKDAYNTQYAQSNGYNVTRVISEDVLAFDDSFLFDILQEKHILVPSINSKMTELKESKDKYNKRIKERKKRYKDKPKGFKGFVLDDHWKFRNDITKEDIIEACIDHPTAPEFYKRLNISRNLLKRLTLKFFNMGIIEFSAKFLAISSNTNWDIVKAKVEFVESGFEIPKVITPFQVKKELVNFNSYNDFFRYMGRSRNHCIKWCQHVMGITLDGLFKGRYILCE